MKKLFLVLFLFNFQVYAQETYKHIGCLEAGGYYGVLKVDYDFFGESVVVQPLNGYSSELARQLGYASNTDLVSYLRITFNPQDCSTKVKDNDQFSCKGNARIRFMVNDSGTDDQLKTTLDIYPSFTGHFATITIQTENGVLAEKGYNFYKNGIEGQGCEFY